MTVSNIEELDDVMINVMAADDILKFFETSVYPLQNLLYSRRLIF